MRELVFRAWDADGERFSYSNEESDLYCWGFENGELKAWAIVEKQDDPMEPPYPAGEEIEPIEQDTGLKDKAGVEIWENDVVRLQSQYETDGPIDCNVKVLFREGAFRLDFHNMLINHNIASGVGNWFIEVIGDVHSNPELIERLK